MGGTMIHPVTHNDNYAMAAKMLDAVVMRHEAIASNIANVETPGYRRVDIDTEFLGELRTQLQSGAPQWNDVRLKLIEDPNAKATRADGNSVEIERELVEMNRNTVAHEFLSEVISMNIKQLKVAITGRIT